MAQQQLVITLLSDDRPGIVKHVADSIALAKGNWLESRMSQLAGKFAGILKVSVEESHVSSLTQELEALSHSGIQVLIDKANTLEHNLQLSTLAFELIGADRVGIISEIAQAFSEKGISIDELETHCSSTPWSGEPLFEATGVLLAPKQLNKHDLLDQLDIIEEKLGITISLTEQL